MDNQKDVAPMAEKVQCQSRGGYVMLIFTGSKIIPVHNEKWLTQTRVFKRPPSD